MDFKNYILVSSFPWVQVSNVCQLSVHSRIQELMWKYNFPRFLYPGGVPLSKFQHAQEDHNSSFKKRKIAVVHPLPPPAPTDFSPSMVDKLRHLRHLTGP